MMVKWFASGISSYVTGNPYRARWPAKSAVCLRNSGSSALPTTSDSGFDGPPSCIIGELRREIASSARSFSLR